MYRITDLRVLIHLMIFLFQNFIKSPVFLPTEPCRILQELDLDVAHETLSTEFNKLL